MLVKSLRKHIHKEQFQPSFIGIFINPFYFARKGLYIHIHSLAHLINGKILDVGCGQKPYEYLFNATNYVGLEIDTPENHLYKKADYFYDGQTFPFPDCSFDGIICNQVLEHVFTPDTFLLEVNRVLKGEGVFLLTVPFIWDEHEQPYDYARYSSFGLRYLLEKHGFEILENRKSMADIRAIFQLIAGFIYKKTLTKSNTINLLITIILISPFNILGEFASWLLPQNDDLYLDNVILAKKVA